jgi:site-specific DNA-adenine methylase
MNPQATWFIDPPYKINQTRRENNDRYPYGDIDYAKLADFIRSRRGLVIACEGEGADYLPFKFLTSLNANTNNKAVKKQAEYIYVRNGGGDA